MEAESPQPSYEELAGLVTAQASRIAELEVEVAELRRRLGMNSTNSSKAPSSDQPGASRRQRAGGRGAGRRRGKQPGASGSALRLADDPDETREHRPQVCANPACGQVLDEASEYGRQRRQVVDLPPVKPYVIEHQLVALRCGGCGQVSEPDVPQGVTGRVQYGPGLTTWCAIRAGSAHDLVAVGCVAAGKHEGAART